MAYRDEGNYLDKALENYFASLKIKEEIGDKKNIANTYGNIGLVYINQGNYPEALKNHFASLKIREEIGNKDGIATCCIDIGTGQIKNACSKGSEGLAAQRIADCQRD